MRFAQAMESGAYPLTKRGGMRPHQLLDACARSKTIRKRYTTLVEDAIARVIREKKVGTYDVGMKNSTTEVAQEVAKYAAG